MISAVSVIIYSVIVLLIDLPWLYLVGPWASDMIRSIQTRPLEFRVWPAAVVYLAIGVLLQFARSVQDAAILGSMTYAVYDFTNYSTLTRYQLPFALADSTWGGVLFAAAYYVKNKVLAKWID
jgi:uncharacterized membrane protein